MENKTLSFNKLTKQYQLSKTLRFELKPMGRTINFLDKIIKKDKIINEAYNQAKFYFDMLHREFIESALTKEKAENINFQEFAKIFYRQNQIIKKIKNEKKDRKEIQNEINKSQKLIDEARKNLYVQIRKLFDEEAENWKMQYKDKLKKSDIKQKGVNFLMSAGVLEVLKDKFPLEKEEEFQRENRPSLYIKDELTGKKAYIFEKFDKFTTYLIKFQQTRKNLYATDGESTSVITRIVSNFEIFLKNKEVFENKYQNKYQEIGFPTIDIFEIDYYLNCLTQIGIEELENQSEDKTSYNKIIGQINKKIKEYRDKKEKGEFPLLRKLDRQILGIVEKEEELIKATKDKNENEVFLEKFKEFITENQKRISNAQALMDALVKGEFQDELGGIYLKQQAINTISRKWFSDWRNFLFSLPQASKNKEEKVEPKIKKFVSLQDIKNAVEAMEGDIFKDKYYQENIISQGSDKWQQFLQIWKYEFDNLFQNRQEGKIIIYNYNSALDEAEKLNSFNKNNKEEIAIVKNYCDSALKIYQMMKYFDLGDKEKKGTPTDFSTNFYARFDEYYKDYEFIKYYNAFRNYLTKKPYSEEKIKLNFDCGTLLGGFDKNKEKDNLSVILRKDGFYYLGIINKENKNIFDEKKNKEIYQLNEKGDYYEKMEYKLFPDPKRMIPKIAFAKKNRKNFGWSQEIQDIKDEYAKFQNKKKYDRNTWKDQFDRNKMAKLINYYQQCLERGRYKEEYDLSWKQPNEYSGIGEFNNDISRQNYYLKFRRIDKSYIDTKVNNGELYLFLIYNKDFSRGRKGKENIHSLYFLNLFPQSNEKLNNAILKLSGNGEIFFRPASLQPQEEKRNFPRQITKYKRYTQDKYLFHLPVSINLGLDQPRKFNQEINLFFAENKDKFNIIGIDRGEKNLLYYCVANQKGQILEQDSLNKIAGVNYFEKLVEKEKERQLNRQSWQPVAQIKDLKKGYISYAVQKICALVEKYNAIVVLEDLNMRFKQIRSGIERAVYQQFEKALIDKLNYLVFKDGRDIFSSGGILNGYQLTAPFVSFRKMGKQTGILFYTNAEYTSQTDPLTGFRKNIYISNSASAKKIKETLAKFKAIGWDGNEESYYLTYNPFDFDKNNISKEWTVYSKVPRIRREKNTSNGYWEYKPIDLNKEFKDLFEKYGFNPEKNNILPDIINKMKVDDQILMEKKDFDKKAKNFYERFIYLFNLISQIRNTASLNIKVNSKNNQLEEIDYGVDFIASPVKPFFTTKGQNEIASKLGKKEVKKVYATPNFSDFSKFFIGESHAKEEFTKNFDSDGVGAYNIARKGIMILNKIKQNPEKPDLYISKLDWDKFVQK